MRHSAVLDRVTSIILILLNVIACSDFLFHHLVFLVFQNKNYINSFLFSPGEMPFFDRSTILSHFCVTRNIRYNMLPDMLCLLFGYIHIFGNLVEGCLKGF